MLQNTLRTLRMFKRKRNQLHLSLCGMFSFSVWVRLIAHSPSVKTFCAYQLFGRPHYEYLPLGLRMGKTGQFDSVFNKISALKVGNLALNYIVFRIAIICTSRQLAIWFQWALFFEPQLAIYLLQVKCITEKIIPIWSLKLVRSKS